MCLGATLYSAWSSINQYNVAIYSWSLQMYTSDSSNNMFSGSSQSAQLMPHITQIWCSQSAQLIPHITQIWCSQSAQLMPHITQIWCSQSTQPTDTSHNTDLVFTKCSTDTSCNTESREGCLLVHKVLIRYLM